MSAQDKDETAENGEKTAETAETADATGATGAAGAASATGAAGAAGAAHTPTPSSQETSPSDLIGDAAPPTEGLAAETTDSARPDDTAQPAKENDIADAGLVAPAAPVAPVAPAADDIPTLAPEKAAAEAAQQLAELNEQVLRLAAELENTRKRAKRDREDALRYGAARFARDMIAVGDNLGRALQAITDTDRENLSDNIAGLLDGVAATERDLLAALQRNGVQQINPQGEKFDANFHEAMFEAADTGKPAGTIIEVVEIGYMIGDRLLRAAKVGIAANGTAQKDSPAQNDTPEQKGAAENDMAAQKGETE